MDPRRPPAPARSHGPFRHAPRPSPGMLALLVLAAALILPELVLSGADLGLWGSARWRSLAYAQGGFWTGLLHGWRPNYPLQPWVMFASYSFLHAGPSHLAGNVVALAWLVRLLRPPGGPRASAGLILLVYFVAALAGAGMFGLLSRQPAPMVGASGALFGLMGAWLVREARGHLAGGQRPCRVLLRLGLAAVLLVLLNLVMWWLQAGRLAWQTHLGGFLAGAGLAALLPRRPGADR